MARLLQFGARHESQHHASGRSWRWRRASWSWRRDRIPRFPRNRRPRSSRTRSRSAWCWCRWSSAPARVTPRAWTRRISSSASRAGRCLSRASSAARTPRRASSCSRTSRGAWRTAASSRESQQALRFFLDKSLPGDEFSIATFAGGIFEVEVPFTRNQGALREASDTLAGLRHDGPPRRGRPHPRDLAGGAQPEALRPPDHRRRRQRQPPDPRAGAGDRPGGPAPHLRAGAGRGQPLRAGPGRERRSTATPTC